MGIFNFFKSKKLLNSEFLNDSEVSAIGLLAFETGGELLDNNKIEEALPYLDQAIKCGVEEAYSDRAWCLERLHLDEEAIEDFTRAIKKNSKDGLLYYGRAKAKHRNMDYDGAVLDAERALEYLKDQNDLEFKTEVGLFLDICNIYARDYKEQLQKIKIAEEIGTDEALQSIKGILALHKMYRNRSKKR